MKVLLLGTGAADGIPAFHGNCRVCTYARENRGKDLRTRAAAVIDKVLKIDLGPDTLAQMHQNGLTASEWSALLFTHSDDDHFSFNELQYALYPFTDMDHLGFTIYGNPNIVAVLRERYPEWPMEIFATKSFCPFGHCEYKITPIRAKHLNGEDAQNFVIEKGGRKFIYATDTGLWEAPTWEFLKGVAADAMVIECTDGFNPSGYEGHLSIESCVGVVERLRREGGLKGEARVVTTHHSHRGGATHAELEEALRPHGIEPGFDGMSFEV
jgi:phosphoribosyl 1,2-cyclic phosphate phosphodiesterase